MIAMPRRENETDDYATRQTAYDRQYRKEYTAWIATLPPDQRATLKRAKLDHALVPLDGHGSPEVSDDAMPYEPNVCDLDTAGDTAAEKFGHLSGPQAARAAAEWIGKQAIAEDRIEIVRQVSHGIMGMPSLRPEVLASIQGASPDSLAEIARRNGVTRAASHKVCVELEKDFAAQGILSHRRQRTPEQRARIAEGVRNAHKKKTEALRMVEEWQKENPRQPFGHAGEVTASDTITNGVNLPVAVNGGAL